MCLKCGGISDGYFITCLLLSPAVKEMRKSVNDCQSYGQE